MRYVNRFALKTAAGAMLCVLALTAGSTGSRGSMAWGAQTGRAAEDQVPLPLKLPKAVYSGTPSNTKAGPNVEKLSNKPRPVPMVPKGTINLALHKPVTSSKKPYTRSLDLVTDGDKEAREDNAVELWPKLQWIQIDLGASQPLFYVVAWHSHLEPVVYHCVIVQVSDDPTFTQGVQTLFNNDQDNVAGLGIGKDREYFETNEGKLIDAKGIKARYVRLYSRGSTGRDPLNRYTEVEVYGLPSK